MLTYCMLTTMIYITLSFMLLQLTHSLNIRTDGNSSGKSKGFRRVLETLASSKYSNEQVPKPMTMYDMLANQLHEEEKKSNHKRNSLRSVVNLEKFTVGAINTEHAGLVERELQDTEAKHSSLLIDGAYVEKKGLNDFLVLKPGISDPFVTIIPNDIYYNNGPKTCVNWLDECSIQGIRARLLHRVRAPFK